MKQVYMDYLTEKGMDPAVMAAIWTLVQTGEGLPMRLLDHNYYPVIEDCLEQGYIQMDSEDRLYLTKKSQAFLDTLLTIAKDEGEL